MVLTIAKRKVYSSGSEYYGQFNMAGKRHGHGVHKWIEADSYAGQWLNGIRTGEGVYKTARGDIYRSTFLNGDMCGT